MKLRAVLCVSLLLVVPMVAAWGQEEGKASGTLTVNGQKTQLKYAYAQISKNSPEDEQEFVRVILSDVPIPPLRMGTSALRKMAKEGKLHALEVSITSDNDTVGGTILDPAIDDGYVPTGSDYKFEPKTLDGKMAAGRLVMEEEGSFFDTHFQFDVTFRAAVAPYPLSLSEADKAAIGAQKPGTASGEFTVSEQTSKLAYAYVVGRREFPGDPEKLSIVLSDAPIPEDVLLAGFGMQSLADEGKVHAVEVEIDADRAPKGGQFYHTEFAKRGGGASLSASGMHYFLAETFDKDTVSGKLMMKEGDDFMGTEYYYQAVFRAAVLRKAPPTYEGAKAALSGPGKVVTAFMSAARLGNKVALKKLVTPQMAAQLDGPDGTMILKMAKATFPLGMKVVEVTEKGDTAEVVAMKSAKGSKETVKLHALRINAEWKVGQEGGEEAPAKPRDPPAPEQLAAAASGPGKLVLAFVDAIHEKDVAKMKALSENPEHMKDMEGPFGEMALELLSKMFPWDLRITRVTESGDTAVVEAETASAKEPLKMNTVRIKGVWKMADEQPKEEQPK